MVSPTTTDTGLAIDTNTDPATDPATEKGFADLHTMADCELHHHSQVMLVSWTCGKNLSQVDWRLFWKVWQTNKNIKHLDIFHRNLFPGEVLPLVIALLTAASQPTPSPPPTHLSGWSTYLQSPDMTFVFRLGLATLETWLSAPSAPWRASSPCHGWRRPRRHIPLQGSRFQLSSMERTAGRVTRNVFMEWFEYTSKQVERHLCLPWGLKPGAVCCASKWIVPFILLSSASSSCISSSSKLVYTDILYCTSDPSNSNHCVQALYHTLVFSFVSINRKIQPMMLSRRTSFM